MRTGKIWSGRCGLLAGLNTAKRNSHPDPVYHGRRPALRFGGNAESAEEVEMRSAPCDLSADAAVTDALFASALQRSDKPSARQVEQAVAAAIRAFGELGCAARVAQAYGEDPDTAVTRMRWARAMVADAA
jgi:hypothetical protein